MFTYIKMKRNEWKIKSMLYGMIVAAIDSQKEVLGLIQKMYLALKDVPADELRSEFVNRLAEIIHEEGKDKTE